VSRGVEEGRSDDHMSKNASITVWFAGGCTFAQVEIHVEVKCSNQSGDDNDLGTDAIKNISSSNALS
jgi:hypothetical protein